MIVLVTGAGGFLGGAIARELVARGDTVHGFSRGAYTELTELGVVQFRGDLGSAEVKSVAFASLSTRRSNRCPPFDSHSSHRLLSCLVKKERADRSVSNEV